MLQLIVEVMHTKAVFSLQSSQTDNTMIPLLFMEYFQVVAGPEDDHEGVSMYRVQRPMHPEHPPLFCPVVPLTSVLHTLELVPVFSTKLAGVQVSSKSCLDVYQQYYVNCFADKETYCSLG